MALNSLGNLFGKSPFGPIQEHMQKVQHCVEALGPFFDSALANEWPQARKHQKAVVKLENQADAMKTRLRLHLPKNLFLPVPRSDLLELIGIQDDIANRAKDIAGLMLGRKMGIPEPLAESMFEYIGTAIATSAQALKAIEELDELLETGFRGREVSFVETLIDELDNLEHQADKQQVDIRGALYKLEKDLPPVDVMFLYQIIDWVGDLSDRAQRVGSRLQVIISR
ncbi:MAG: TIGR00153 family protein [Spongiibacteraceae bacterium]